jgi:hypothetical protein
MGMLDPVMTARIRDLISATQPLVKTVKRPFMPTQPVYQPDIGAGWQVGELPRDNLAAALLPPAPGIASIVPYAVALAQYPSNDE